MDYFLKPQLYGKLPLQGDFIYQLPESFTGIWDKWLQQGLAYSQDYFTQNWKAVFQQSHSLYFFLAPEICGDKAWLGIMMPSYDKVGRNFPITLAVELPLQVGYELLESEAINAWLQHLERAIKKLFRERNLSSLDDFQKSLAVFKLSIEVKNSHDETQQPLIKTNYYYQGNNQHEKDKFYDYIKQHFLKNRLQKGFCLWASNHSPMSRLFSSGLPPKELFSAFLDRDYEGWGWKSVFPDDEKTIRPLKRVKSIYKNLQKQSPFSWYSSALTDAGNRRTINEDNYLIKDNLGLWVIADGMGGYDSGDYASEVVIEILSSLKKPYKMSEFVNIVEEKIIAANHQLLNYFTDLETQGGCTIVCLLTFAHYGIVIWAGDSRLYRHRAAQLKMLTRDHSEAEDAVDRGEMTTEEAKTHLSGNIITRAIGIEENLYLDMDIFSIQSGDLLLLCSDGLYKEMTDKEIEQQINENSADINTITHSLMSIALANKGRDNITIILVKIE